MQFSDLMMSCIQYKFCTNAIIFWTSIIKQWIGKVCHSFHAQIFSTIKEACLLHKAVESEAGEEKKIQPS